LICADIGASGLATALWPLAAVALALTFLVSDAATETCLTARTTARLLAIPLAAVHAAVLTARMTDIAPGLNLIFRQPDDAAFERCRVKSHEDFPRHIYRLFLVLGIQFRWVLTSCTLARALVTQADLAIDNAKETSWMELYAPDIDTLEDILYRRLQDLWAPLTDAMKVFDTYGSAQQLCAQKV
jgi:hypothetical protein